MSMIPRILLFLGLGCLLFVLFKEARIVNSQPDVDASKVVLLFGSIVVVGSLTGVLFVIMIMPSIGEAIGNFFFQPNQQISRDPHADAQAALARGDYSEAVDEYRKAIEKKPDDTLAYSEIAKISCEHLADAEGAAQTLEEALDQEWPPDDAAFLSSRLVDVYWDHQHDAQSARTLLLQIIEAMPETRHAANAQHRLNVIDQETTLEE